MRFVAIFFMLVLSLMTGCLDKKNTEQKKVSPENNTALEQDSISSKFRIEILDDQGLQLIDPNAQIEIMASGFEWTEGPVWIEDGEYLLFSDIPNNKVYQLKGKNDTLTYLYPSGFSAGDFTGTEPGSNGLLLNGEGELILMQHGNRQVAKMDAPLAQPTEAYIPLVSSYRGKRFNSPNDGVFDAAGNLYFTDPPYGLPNQLEDEAKELHFQGVYCLLNNGELILLDDTLKLPNGIGISPDGSKLYVAVSNAEKAAWYEYDIEKPGKVANRKTFCDVTHLVDKEGQQGLPDGLKVHSSGTLFATGPGGVWIFNPNGKVLARIHTGQKTANCALANNEKRLFMTANDYVLVVDLK